MLVKAILAAIAVHVVIKIGFFITKAIEPEKYHKALDVRANSPIGNGHDWAGDFNNQWGVYYPWATLSAFIAVVFLFVVTGSVDLVAVLMAWAYVLFSTISAVQQRRSNPGFGRFKAFALETLIALSLWVWLAWQLGLIG